MKKQLIRFLISAIASAFVWAGTHYWYQKNKVTASREGAEPPIAFARSVSEDVHRKPEERTLAQLITEGEALYSGDTIRTSEHAEVKIEFISTSQIISLEQDTSVVIKKDTGNGISLDLMDGSLFVTQSAKAPVGDTQVAALNVTAGNKKIDLSNATAQVSKSKTGQADIQTYKGKVQVESNGQQEEVDSQRQLSSLEILSPSKTKPTYFNPENPTPILFSWKGMPKNTLVTLSIGKTRLNMNSQISTNDEKQSALSQKLTPGRYRWQLTAKDPTTNQIKFSSSVFRLDVQERFAPAAIAPLKDEVFLRTGNAKQEVTFRWEVPEKAKQLYFEVGKDVDMKQIVSDRNLSTESSMKLPLEDGEYFWRISAVYDDDEGAKVSSRPMKFVITSKKVLEPPKPQILISWTNPNDRSPQYFVEQPEIALNWKSDQAAQVKNWRVKISESDAFITNPNLTEGVEIFSASTTTFKTQMKKPGRYIASVEALDEKQNVLARVPQALPVSLEKLPILQSPVLLPEKGDLTADNFGKFTLKWTKVEGAKEYRIIVMGMDGNEKVRLKTTTESHTWPGLSPGTYKVAVKAIDRFDRESDPRPSRNLIVPNVSGVGAPKLNISVPGKSK